MDGEYDQGYAVRLKLLPTSPIEVHYRLLCLRPTTMIRSTSVGTVSSRKTGGQGPVVGEGSVLRYPVGERRGWDEEVRSRINQTVIQTPFDNDRLPQTTERVLTHVKLDP